MLYVMLYMLCCIMLSLRARSVCMIYWMLKLVRIYQIRCLSPENIQFQTMEMLKSLFTHAEVR